VLHTKPRTEKSLGRCLHSRQVLYFLPLYRHSRRQRGRTFTSFLPLFPGYLFFRGNEDARLIALETNQVVQVLRVPDQEQLYKDLTRVNRLLSGEAPLHPETGLRPGAKVLIVSGPFEGIEGKLLHSGGKARLVVEVKFLRQGVSVEVEPWMIREL
jgi:transcription antitermination factor NusG